MQKVRLDGYVRVSKVGGREGPTFISPAVQRERLHAQAKVNGHTVAQVHEDLDLPGTHSQRPGLQAALGRVEAGKTNGIIVAKLDRFGRSAIDIHRNVERVREAGGELLTAAEGINTATPMGRFFLAICAAFAELEIERIGENWEAARARAIERGVHISGAVPVGYLRRDSGVLAPDPARRELVAEAFRRRAAGDSWKSIADWLTAEGVETPHGAPRWTIATVRSVIRNRVYLGEARSGDLVKVGAHHALIEPEIWDAANRRRAPHFAPTGSTAGVLSGVLRCAGCSFALKPVMGKTRHGKPRREYRCRPDKAAGRCPAPASVSAEPVEAVVEERFFADYEDLYARAHQRTENRAEVEGRRAAAQAELEAALDERLADALGGADSDLYIATVRRRREAAEALDEELAALDAEDAELPSPRTLRADWPNRTLEQRRALIGAAYDAIFLRRASDPREPAVDRLRFFDLGEGPPLPVRGKRSEIRSVPVD